MDKVYSIENIIIALKARWTERVRGEEISKLNNAVCNDIAEELQCYNDKDRKDLFEWLKAQQYAPKLYTVKKGAEILGLSKSSSNSFFKKNVLQCVGCNTYYAQIGDPLAAYCCPRCGELDSKISEHPGDKDVIYVNEYCLINQHGKVRCGVLAKKLTQRTNGINSDCPSYGRGVKIAKCADCQCSDCCDYAYQQNNSTVRYNATELFEELRKSFKEKLKNS